MPLSVLSNSIVVAREWPAAPPSPLTLRKAEVQHLDDTLGRDLDIRRLQVPVDDPVLMCRLQRLGDLPRDRQRVGDLHRASSDQIGQCLALYQFHDQPAYAAGFFEAVNDDDVGMIQCCQRTCLALGTGGPGQDLT